MNAIAPAVDPDALGAAWMRAMRTGDFEGAWQQTDRLEASRRAGGARESQHLVWDGTPMADRVVLVRCLHGLGDTIQFMRFVPQVVRSAKHVHFLVQPPLLELLRSAPDLGEVSNAWTDDPPPHEVEIEVMELAYALRVRADTLPPPYPHLAHCVRRHVPVLSNAGEMRVGIVWAASEWDSSRSVPLELLEPVLRLPGVRFFHLQQGQPALDPGADRLGLVPLWRDTGTIEAAASAMLQMDLMIAIDAMPAHLAATLGRPTWLLLKHEADWRWMRGCTDSAWYPSMRIFRQASEGDWASVVDEVRERLAATRERRAADTLRAWT